MKNLFETNRLIIRNFVEKDIASLMVYRNNLDWMQYQGFKGLSHEEYRKSLLTDSTVESGMQLAIVNKLNKTLIGDLYLKKDNEDIYIGYTINPEFSRLGFMQEAVKGLIEFIKTKHQNISILAETTDDNLASINFLKKLKFNFVKKRDKLLIFKYKD